MGEEEGAGWGGRERQAANQELQPEPPEPPLQSDAGATCLNRWRAGKVRAREKEATLPTGLLGGGFLLLLLLLLAKRLLSKGSGTPASLEEAPLRTAPDELLPCVSAQLKRLLANGAEGGGGGCRGGKVAGEDARRGRDPRAPGVHWAGPRAD